jgi:hypothetical protein
MIDAYATWPHYVDHIAPIWNALPEKLRGEFVAPGYAAASRARDAGIPTMSALDEAHPRMTLVAAWADEQHLIGRPVVLVEHGIGQSYSDHQPGYPGGREREAVCLFICPSERVARRWSEMYPETPCAVVGVPKLDPWHGRAENNRRWRDQAADLASTLPVVVVSFHWPCAVVPECGNAWDYYSGVLFWMARMSPEERGFHLLGHAHPKARDERQWMEAIGLPFVEHFDEVLDAADLYVCDNSSTIYEFASTDRPVVVLNRPEYRRDVEHGGRFWEWANVGVECDHPDELMACIEIGLRDEPSYAAVRRAVVDEVYAYTDGQATERAVAAIVQAHADGYWRAWRSTRDPSNPKAPIPAATLAGPAREIVGLLRAKGLPLDEATAAALRTASADDLARLRSLYA